MKQSIVRKAFKDTIPVMSGYLVLGIGFGVVLASRTSGIYCQRGGDTASYLETKYAAQYHRWDSVLYDIDPFYYLK